MRREAGCALTDKGTLQNEGVLALNKPVTSPAEKTVVVLGVARSGTTAVASVLQALGVFMGERLGSVLEDVALSEAVEARDGRRLRDLVNQRNADHPVWGWKRPSALEHVDAWKEAFRNPYVIAVFRDPFAIANRNRISMLTDVFQNMARSVKQLDAMVRFLEGRKGPVLLCSYEKILAFPEAFVKAVDDFLDLNAAELWTEAVRRIVPSPREYLETSRITHSQGHLGVVDERMCSGWAFYPRVPGRIANVQVFVNDRLVHVAEARLPRPDVKEKGIHPTGTCGFRFEWPEGTAPRAGDRIEARVEGDINPLQGSPKLIGTKETV